MQHLGSLGSPLQAIGSIVQGVGGQQAGRYNQAVSNLNAVNAENDAAAQVLASQDSARQAIGQQIVGQAGSGFVMGTGSAADELVASQTSSMLDALNLRRAGALKAQAYQQQGALARMQGDNAMTAGLFGAASALVKRKTNYAAAGGAN